MRTDGARLGCGAGAAQRAADAALTDHVIALARRLPPGRRLALRASGGRRLVTDAWDDYITLVRLGRDGRRPDPARARLGRRRRPARRRLAPRRRLRDVRGRATRSRASAPSGSRAARRLVGLERAAHRLPVPARLAGAPADALPGGRGARRRHPRGCRRRRGRERRRRPRRCRSRCASTRTPPVARGCCRPPPSPPTRGRRRARGRRCDERRRLGRGADRRRGAAARARGRACQRAAPRRWPTVRTRSRGRSPTPRATAPKAARASAWPTRRRRRSDAPQPPNGAVARRAATCWRRGRGERRGLRPRPRVGRADLLDGAPVGHVWQAGGVVHAVVGARLAAGVHHLVLAVADRAGNPARLAWDMTVARRGRTCRERAGGRRRGDGRLAGAAPASPGARARKRAASVRAVVARIGAARPRVVIVRLRARPGCASSLRVHCGTVVRTLRVRANARGIATVRVACAGAATVRMVGRAGQAARSHRRPPAAAAPAGAARSGARHRPSRASAVSWPSCAAASSCSRRSPRPAGAAWVRRAPTPAGRFATSFAIVHAGQFALRARVAALAADPSAPFVLTMR